MLVADAQTETTVIGAQQVDQLSLLAAKVHLVSFASIGSFEVLALVACCCCFFGSFVCIWAREVLFAFPSIWKFDFGHVAQPGQEEEEEHGRIQ